MTKFSLILLLSLSAFAQKKPITLESLQAGGRGGAGFAGLPRGCPMANLTRTLVFKPHVDGEILVEGSLVPEKRIDCDVVPWSSGSYGDFPVRFTRLSPATCE